MISLHADPDTWENLQKRLKRSESGAIKDIYDGVGYNKHSDFLKHPAHISLLFNTDGVAMFRSSKISIWPVWAVVNELPPTLRYVFSYGICKQLTHTYRFLKHKVFFSCLGLADNICSF